MEFMCSLKYSEPDAEYIRSRLDHCGIAMHPVDEYPIIARGVDANRTLEIALKRLIDRDRTIAEDICGHRCDYSAIIFVLPFQTREEGLGRVAKLLFATEYTWQQPATLIFEDCPCARIEGRKLSPLASTLSEVFPIVERSARMAERP